MNEQENMLIFWAKGNLNPNEYEEIVTAAKNYSLDEDLLIDLHRNKILTLIPYKPLSWIKQIPYKINLL